MTDTEKLPALAGRVVTKWAKKNYPDKGFKVTAQKDGPVIVSVKGDEEVGRTVVFLKEKHEGD